MSDTDDCGAIVEPVGVFGRFMLDIQTAIRTIPGVKSCNVHVGHYEFTKETEFYQSLCHEGFEFFIGSPEADADMTNLNGDFQLTMEMSYTIPADHPNNLIAITKMQSMVYVALSSNYTQWVSGGNRPPVRVTHGAIEWKRYEKPFVLNNKFTLYGRFIADQASDPFVVPVV